MVRKIGKPLIFWLSSTARKKAKTILSGTLPSVYTAVTRSDFQKSGSCENIRWMFSVPIQFGVLAMFQSVKAISKLATIGPSCQIKKPKNSWSDAEDAPKGFVAPLP